MNGEHTWMVGFHSMVAGSAVERFYVVKGAADECEAHRSAVLMAEGEGGVDTGLQACRVRIQRLVPDTFGAFELSDPLHGAAPDRGCADERAGIPARAGSAR